MQVGKISAYDLQKNFTSFYSEMNGTTGSGFFYYCHRVIHNQEQVIRVQHRDGTSNPPMYIKYWNMDGSAAAQFTVGSGGVAYKSILDIAWINDEQKFVYITMDPSLVSGNTYNIYKCTSDGNNPELLVSQFDGNGQWANWYTSTTSGYVGIAANSTDIFVKVGTNLFKFPEGVRGDWGSISPSVPVVSNAFHYGNGADCRNLMYQPVTSTGITASGYLLYTWYDSSIDSLYLRSIDPASLTYLPTKWAMLNIDNYAYCKEPIFLNQLDYNSLHIVRPVLYSGPVNVSGVYAAAGTSSQYRASGTATSLNVFNIDESLAAFLNVNSTDTVMPAGIGAQATIIAKVTNCWGTTLSGKLVQFWVSSGDGGVSPTWSYTDDSGTATTLYSTGANVGISNVAVVVNEI
jgi:hypothetical protein